MVQRDLLQLAKDLEWLAGELEYYGHRHAMEGFPHAGPNWDTFLEKQKSVLRTADKIDRELKTAISFNPEKLVGVEYPLEETLDSITTQLAAVEEIKRTAVYAVQDLPSKARAFTQVVESYLQTASTGKV